MDDKKILDVTCGSRTIWFNKEHPAAVYCDIREEELTGIWKSGDGQGQQLWHGDVTGYIARKYKIGSDTIGDNDKGKTGSIPE